MSTKKKILIAVVVVILIVAVYFLWSKKKSTVAVAATSSALQQRYNGQTKQLSAIDSASPEDLAIWQRLMDMWDRGASTQELYSTYPNGTTGASWDNSIGKWWENFSAAHGF